LKILLLRLRLIGDVVFTTPVIGALRRRFPDAHITYLVEPSAAPVVSTNRDLSEVLVVPHTRGWQRIKDDVRLARRLRAERFDLAIDLHGGPRSGLLTWATRAPVRVGYDVPGRVWSYSRVVHRPRMLRARHSVENQWDLLAAVDPAFTSPPDRSRDRVVMPVDPGARSRVDRWLREHHVPEAARLVVVHVSAGNPFRRWPETAFADLTVRLIGHDANRWVLLTGGPSDQDAAERVRAAARAQLGADADRVLDGEGMSLPELRALMDRASLFIGGDSGPLHVAATSDVPVVGLFGPTLKERSAPWRPPDLVTLSVDMNGLSCRPCEQRHCVPGDFRCLTHISSSVVLSAAERALAGKG
jgi:lipopolysaccharide heptosyltransferase II